MAVPRWIPLQGAANVRDVGGLRASAGEVIPGRLIRADNLQGLTEADVRELVEVWHVTAVADLRTQVELDSEGPGPLVRDGRVDIRHLSLFPEAGSTTDVAADADTGGSVLLPWLDEDLRAEHERRGGFSYMWYLRDRPDSVVAAARLVAYAEGATVVHCAAGKDRTGVVIAVILDAVGVDRDAIVEDYVRTGDRIEQIFHRLASSSTYASDLDEDYVTRSRLRPEAIRDLFATVDAEDGGTANWLAAHGWTGDDDAALRRSLLGES